MHEHGTLKLFNRGPSAEFRLCLFVLLSIGLLLVDARWTVLDPMRQALSVAIYPFQRTAMAPRDLVDYVDSWSNAASLARAEQDALRRQQIEMAQLSNHAAQLAAENQQLRRLLN